MSQHSLAVLRADIARDLDNVRRLAGEAEEWGSKLADWPHTVKVRTAGGIIQDFYSRVERVFRQIAGQEAVGAPDLEAERQIHKMRKWLARHVPDDEVTVRAAIVFVNPNVDLDSEGSSVPAFYGKKVKAWLRGPGKLKPWPAAARSRLEQALGIDDGAEQAT